MVPIPAGYPGVLLQFHNLCSRNVRELVLNVHHSQKNNNLSLIKEGLFVCLFCLSHRDPPNQHIPIVCCWKARDA
jgi:hypothetical protein